MIEHAHMYSMPYRVQSSLSQHFIPPTGRVGDVGANTVPLKIMLTFDLSGPF